MVYCGKPSAGCAECRQRKTRCDKAVPSCGQCLRTSRTCSGYRDKLDLMFRSENENVVGKTKSRAAASNARSRSPTGGSAAAAFSSNFSQAINTTDRPYSIEDSKKFGILSESAPIFFSIGPTFTERGRGFFGATSSNLIRNHELVDQLCLKGDKPLLASISALGLASYANSVPSPEIFHQARLNYVNALQLTNAALRSPEDVHKDSTLASVFILGMFEIVAGSSEKSLEAWTEHVNGATALLKLRGSHQFRTKAGQQLFIMITANVMVSCIQRTIPMPDHIIKLHRMAHQLMDISAWPAWQASKVIFDFANYRAMVRDCVIVGPRAVIEAGLEVDRKFIAAFSNVPEAWEYHSVYTDQDDECVWNRRYDVYNDSWTAQIWNGMRCCRVLLHEIIRDQLLATSTAMTPFFTLQELKKQNAQTVHTMLKLQADILATLPLHVPSSVQSFPSSLMEGSRGYFIVWPLYIAGVMDLATQPIKTWVIGRLKAISQQVGIRQAGLLADVLEAHRHIRAWDTKPAPRLRKDGTIYGWTPASGVGTIRPDWWDVEPLEADTPEGSIN